MGLDRFLPAVFDAHRPVSVQGEQAQEDLDGNVFFAAKTAPDHGALDVQPVLRDVERQGNAAEVFHHLGADADVDHVALVDPGHAGFGLDVGMFDERHRVGVLDHQVSLGHAFLQIAFTDLPARHDVIGCGNHRSAGLHGLQRVVNRREGFVFDFDQLGGPVRRYLASRRLPGRSGRR